MSILNKLTTVRDAIKYAVLEYGGGISVFHYSAAGAFDDYVVWAEESGTGSLQADNKLADQKISGTVDYFTKKEFSCFPDSLQHHLDSNGIAFYLNSVQYEDETELIHYEWVFEV